MSISCKIPHLAALLGIALALGLTGCPVRPSDTQSAQHRRVPGQAVPGEPELKREGRPYDIVTGESLLTVRVFRGGPLAKAGHNHVIASHTLSGSLYVPADLAHSSFEIRFPVTELTVDEASLRAKENEADFPPDVPDSAKEGTRKNMLGSALLDAEQYPEIVLRSARLEHAAGGSGAEWLAHVQVTVRDHVSSVVAPLHYEQQADDIVVSGEFPLQQSELGLTPFSAMLGALQVVDEMQVRFRVVAHAATTRSGR